MLDAIMRRAGEGFLKSLPPFPLAARRRRRRHPAMRRAARGVDCPGGTSNATGMKRSGKVPTNRALKVV